MIVINFNFLKSLLTFFIIIFSLFVDTIVIRENIFVEVVDVALQIVNLLIINELIVQFLCDSTNKIQDFLIVIQLHHIN